MHVVKIQLNIILRYRQKVDFIVGPGHSLSVPIFEHEY